MEIVAGQPEVVLKENGKPKFTINLQTIFKANRPEDKSTGAESVVVSADDQPVRLEALRQVWEEFAALRKSQHAEYQLLTREFRFENNVVTIPLANPIEEPLLQGLRVQLTAFLRDKLNNSSLTVNGVLEEMGTRKSIYTSKEKFDYLAEKNPMLREMKERLGLDTDF